MPSFKQQFQKLKQQRILLAGLVFAMVAAVLWTAISIYSSQKSLQISAELKQLAKPLVPSLNQKVIDRIDQKQVYDQSELTDFPIYVVVELEDGSVVTTAQKKLEGLNLLFVDKKEDIEAETGQFDLEDQAFESGSATESGVPAVESSDAVGPAATPAVESPADVEEPSPQTGVEGN